jgi:hypothetical protein
MSITTETNHPQPQAQPIPPAAPAYPTTVTQRRPNDYEQGSGQLTGAGAGQYAGSGQYTGAGQSLGSGQFHGIVIALCTVVSSAWSVSVGCHSSLSCACAYPSATLHLYSPVGSLFTGWKDSSDMGRLCRAIWWHRAVHRGRAEPGFRRQWVRAERWGRAVCWNRGS